MSTFVGSSLQIRGFWGRAKEGSGHNGFDEGINGGVQASEE